MPEEGGCLFFAVAEMTIWAKGFAGKGATVVRVGWPDPIGVPRSKAPFVVTIPAGGDR